MSGLKISIREISFCCDQPAHCEQDQACRDKSRNRLPCIRVAPQHRAAIEIAWEKSTHEICYMEGESSERRVTNTSKIEDVGKICYRERDIFVGKDHGYKKRDAESESASGEPERDESQGVDERQILSHHSRRRGQDDRRYER